MKGEDVKTYSNWNYAGTRKTEVVTADEANDYVFYTVSKGRNYYTGKEDTFTKEAKEDFRKNFPEYSNCSTDTLHKLPEEEAVEIVSWFFSGNWVAE